VSTPPLFLLDALPAGAQAVLDGPEGRHAATVKRLRAGEVVLLGDGQGGLAQAVVDATGRDVVELTVTGRSAVPAATPRVVVAQALVKGDRGELAVELATEAGVDAIVPWTAARCVVRWAEGDRGNKGLARWRSTAREAAKQARRAWVPVVHEPASTRVLAERVAAAACALVLHESATVMLADVRLPVTGDVLLVVGPEGGVTEEELDLLTAAGAQAVRLGPEVLRASTAAAVALGALGVLTPRWTRVTVSRAIEHGESGVPAR
jgi:16S rRNA (uracil1498-N3)-methyltransferase